MPLPSSTATRNGEHGSRGEAMGANEMLRGVVAADDGASTGGPGSEHHGAPPEVMVRGCIGLLAAAGAASGCAALLRSVVCDLQ